MFRDCITHSCIIPYYAIVVTLYQENEIWTIICRSRIIIADLTYLNPNVMYELGIAHTLGKETILIYQKQETLIKFPFDIFHIRHIEYENTAIGGKALENNLKETIITILNKNSDIPIFVQMITTNGISKYSKSFSGELSNTDAILMAGFISAMNTVFIQFINDQMQYLRGTQFNLYIKKYEEILFLYAFEGDFYGVDKKLK